ncbi:hypothetical protein GCM10010399_18370 [Dactylosporangium fulvum]
MPADGPGRQRRGGGGRPVFVLTLVVPVLRYRLRSIDTILRGSLAHGGAFCAKAAPGCYPAGEWQRVPPGRGFSGGLLDSSGSRW